MNIGDVVFMIICSSIVLGLAVIGLVLFIRHFQRTLKLVYEDKKETEIKYLKELNKAQLEIKDQTLNQIGRELHDNIGQLLTVSKIHSLSLLKVFPEQQKLVALDSALDKTISEVKVLSKSLDASRIENFGFIHELSLELKRLEQLQFATLQVNVPIHLDLEANRGIILFRVIQEFLNNSMKYSACKKITISILPVDNSIQILLKDDGKGFDMNSSAMGSGVFNIQKRCELLQATEINYISTPGHGTILEFSIPLNPQ